ncbi:hypothetical protein BpHYR1_042148 [Brachionus plicatilis]|uniref:Uncharacterized protein n=1 Tax=Brachionus plicatilis TaxID=10195 RepID=A0A3M7QVS8_BRAPC|nr:hypothetical protein BpHYR1_042148 [Brachionus plicatilis]
MTVVWEKMIQTLNTKRLSLSNTINLFSFTKYGKNNCVIKFQILTCISIEFKLNNLFRLPILSQSPSGVSFQSLPFYFLMLKSFQ